MSSKFGSKKLAPSAVVAALPVPDVMDEVVVSAPVVKVEAVAPVAAPVIASDVKKVVEIKEPKAPSVPMSKKGKLIIAAGTFVALAIVGGNYWWSNRLVAPVAQVDLTNNVLTKAAAAQGVLVPVPVSAPVAASSVAEVPVVVPAVVSPLAAPVPVVATVAAPVIAKPVAPVRIAAKPAHVAADPCDGVTAAVCANLKLMMKGKK